MKIGIIQLCSELLPETNIKKIESFLEEAKAQNVEAVFLPEVFYSMSDGRGATPYLVENNNEHYNAIVSLAKRFSIALIGGSAATKDGNNEKVLNRAYNFDENGNDIGHYDKINVFACDVERNGKRVILDEGRVYQTGSELKVINYKDLVIGLSICFDIRYPEMYREYRKLGVNCLTISSAFTVPTGKAHWETLVKARAIENQCFVIAAGQWGKHNDKIETYGHSMIVDPWGKVLANAEDGEKLITADIDINKVKFVRDSIKLFK